jgi:hypothetical protein
MSGVSGGGHGGERHTSIRDVETHLRHRLARAQGSSTTTTMGDDGPLFCFWRLGGVSPRRSSRHYCGGRFGGGGATRLSNKVLHQTIGDPALLFRTTS